MGFLSDILGKTAPTQNSLQQEGNQMMLKMMQDRLAVSTCPTEKQQLQNNIVAIQKALQQNQVPPQMAPISPPQNVPTNSSVSAKQYNLQPLEQELVNLKSSISRIENCIMALKAQ